MEPRKLLAGVDGKFNQKQIEIGEVSQVQIGGPFHFRFSEAKGDRESVTIEGDSNLFEFLSVDHSQSGKLKISTLRSIRPRLPLTIRLELKSLNSLSLSGDIQARINEFSGNQLSLILAGRVNIASKNPVQLDELNLKAFGMIQTSFDGKVGRLNLQTAGDNQLNLKGFTSDRAEVSISGSSHVNLGTSKAVSGTLTGASTLRYYGKADSIRVQALGQSRVIQQ